MTEIYSHLATYSGDTRLLWIPAAFVFVVGDILTTLYGLEHAGAVETNPMMIQIIEQYGVAGMIGVKLSALGLMYLLATRIEQADGHLIGSLSLLAVASLVVVWNLSQIAIGL